MISLLLCRFIVQSHVASWRGYDEAVFVSCTNTGQRNAVVRTNFIMVASRWNWYSATVTQNFVPASLWYVQILLWYQTYLSYQHLVGIGITATITQIFVPAPIHCNTVYGRIPYQDIFYKCQYFLHTVQMSAPIHTPTVLAQFVSTEKRVPLTFFRNNDKPKKKTKKKSIK